MVFKRFLKISSLSLLLSAAFLSCKTTEKTAAAAKHPELKPSKPPLTLTFAGDIMAHTINFEGGRFEKIFEDIKDFVSDSDFSFANIEAPVNDHIEWKSYPQFNMHTDYVMEAVKAGFNVFSLANNHTNDQGLEGMKGTKKFFDSLEKKGIRAAGVKGSGNAPLTFKVLEKNGWKVLFVAVTEILNGYNASNWIDLYPATEKYRNILIEELKALKEKHKCDATVLSIHADEAEYVRTITKSHKAFYYRLIDEALVDIVWANHPHIIKPFEFYKNGFIMYANGNTISGQRTKYNYENPNNDRDWTGDGLILKVKLLKEDAAVIVAERPEEAKADEDLKQEHGDTFSGSRPKTELTEKLIITSFIDPNYRIVIRKADEDFLHCLDRLNYTRTAEYFRARLKLLKEYLCQ